MSDEQWHEEAKKMFYEYKGEVEKYQASGSSLERDWALMNAAKAVAISVLLEKFGVKLPLRGSGDERRVHKDV